MAPELHARRRSYRPRGQPPPAPSLLDGSRRRAAARDAVAAAAAAVAAVGGGGSGTIRAAKAATAAAVAAGSWTALASASGGSARTAAYGSRSLVGAAGSNVPRVSGVFASCCGPPSLTASPVKCACSFVQPTSFHGIRSGMHRCRNLAFVGGVPVLQHTALTRGCICPRRCTAPAARASFASRAARTAAAAAAASPAGAAAAAAAAGAAAAEAGAPARGRRQQRRRWRSPCRLRRLPALRLCSSCVAASRRSCPPHRSWCGDPCNTGECGALTGARLRAAPLHQ